MTARRPFLIAVSCLALTCPVTLQIDLGQSLSVALTGSPAVAKNGNNGGGNGNGNGNGNSGNNGNSGGNGNGNGNSGNNGNSNGNGNAGGSKGGGNGDGNGNGGGKSNAGGSGNGASNGNGAGNGNGGSKGNGNANGNQGKGSDAGQSGGQGQSSGQNGSPSGGKSSSSQGNARSSPSSVTGGLSSLFGAIAAGFRAPPPDPVVTRRAHARKATAKAKRSPVEASSRQTAARRGIQEDRARLGRKPDQRGMKDSVTGSASQARGVSAPAAAGAALPKPTRAQRSIVAAGLSQAGLDRLKAAGFQAELQTSGMLVSVARLVPPRGMSLGEARRKVRVAEAGAIADFDHFYYADEGAGCTGPGCEAVSLVGWNMPASRQCGPVPTIGLIDTGIDRDHEALQGQSIDVLPMPQNRGAPSLRDHGTAVAALLVGRSGSSTPGLLPDAHVVAVDAFYRDGGAADRTDVTTLVAALEALAERDVRVVNLSLSGPPNEVLKRAIASAQDQGMVIVAAAGNNGPGAAPSYPAAYPGVIAVTAIDRNLAVYGRATQGDYIDLAAPGVNLWVAAPGGGTTRSGTSYAVPFISAAAAVLRASDALPDAASVQASLEGRTMDLGKPGRDRTYGHGLLQATDLCRPRQDETPVAKAAGPSIETP